MKAEFAGRCLTCEQKIRVGDEIARVDGQWVHLECPPEPPVGEVCTRCWIEKSLDGSCLCEEP